MEPSHLSFLIAGSLIAVGLLVLLVSLWQTRETLRYLRTAQRLQGQLSEYLEKRLPAAAGGGSLWKPVFTYQTPDGKVSSCASRTFRARRRYQYSDSVIILHGTLGGRTRAMLDRFDEIWWGFIPAYLAAVGLVVVPLIILWMVHT